MFFRRISHTRASRLATPRIALVAGSLALAVSAPLLMGAGPWDNHRDNHRDNNHGDRRDSRSGWYFGVRGPRTEVILREERPVIIVRTVEVEPFDLALTAYQAGDTVIVVANGSNRTGGFTTSLSALDARAHAITLKLCNIAPRGYCTQAITPFSLTGAIKADCALSTIDIRVADRTICVPVRQVARIG